jgi:hypothetical protein
VAAGALASQTEERKKNMGGGLPACENPDESVWQTAKFVQPSVRLMDAQNTLATVDTNSPVKSK